MYQVKGTCKYCTAKSTFYAAGAIFQTSEVQLAISIEVPSVHVFMLQKPDSVLIYYYIINEN